LDYRFALAQTGAPVAFALTVQGETPNPVLLLAFLRRRRARIMPKLGLRLRARLPLEHRGDVQGLLPPKRQGGVRGVLPPTRWGGLGRLLPLEALFHQAGMRAAPKLPQAVP